MQDKEYFVFSYVSISKADVCKIFDLQVTVFQIIEVQLQLNPEILTGN